MSVKAFEPSPMQPHTCLQIFHMGGRRIRSWQQLAPAKAVIGSRSPWRGP